MFVLICEIGARCVKARSRRAVSTFHCFGFAGRDCLFGFSIGWGSAVFVRMNLRCEGRWCELR